MEYVGADSLDNMDMLSLFFTCGAETLVDETHVACAELLGKEAR